MSSGLGGLNKSPHGVVVGLCQLQLPVIETKDQLDAQVDRVCALVGKARRGSTSMDLVVFPEYMLHGLSMDVCDEIMCERDGPIVARLRAACVQHKIWGCFSIMERNPAAPESPFNSGLIFDADGNEVLYYRKLHPWVPVEPWAPGDLGVPVVDGPNGCKLALIICHDGMFPEMAPCGLVDLFVREARLGWGVENNIYQLGHRAYVAVQGGARDCPYTFMHDLVAGKYRLPWEGQVKHTDGRSCGFPAPVREYAPSAAASNGHGDAKK
ncbi:hypothetical protein EMIHUDRAFT_244108 [Emiliania huxleyi CCMP1516]|uniref:CN hydrolase domain-containing protein n=2 Tax=Emiliania huxleyi TaxID=2903 RepID=A0A0D3J1W7_EMIH1|nr:hypothetical protein EMIHUDRAFT_244108 [Emiliania huxleyi CCMP1516]EOD17502.1 hypothetical protein EMIHUDRAFT_244108 [Emiliania huxleyi CCMP1516]|eukprot:XP_005769931.1 hypothetical protein EMIHUDRAFT_244108 [Emiliania huxleyi CCMP1516]